MPINVSLSTSTLMRHLSRYSRPKRRILEDWCRHDLHPSCHAIRKERSHHASRERSILRCEGALFPLTRDLRAYLLASGETFVESDSANMGTFVNKVSKAASDRRERERCAAAKTNVGPAGTLSPPMHVHALPVRQIARYTA